MYVLDWINRNRGVASLLRWHSNKALALVYVRVEERRGGGAAGGGLFNAINDIYLSRSYRYTFFSAEAQDARAMFHNNNNPSYIGRRTDKFYHDHHAAITRHKSYKHTTQHTMCFIHNSHGQAAHRQ